MNTPTTPLRQISPGLVVALLIGSWITMQTPASAVHDDVLSFRDDTRCWHDATGNYQVDAALVKYQQRQVTLALSNGKTIELSIDKLSKSDQSYLVGKLRAARKAIATSDGRVEQQHFVSVPGDPTESTESTAPQQLANNSTAEKLYGVDWYSTTDASRLASAQHKPIMWFRVLGNLSGVM